MSQELLSAPVAAQGPGPLPPALIDALDLALARRAARALSGDRRAPGVGAGTELAQLRAYQTGDDVRHIDASATARTGTPHVRVHVPERAFTTWMAIDVSPSMAFGTARRLKADVAAGAARVVGHLAVRRGGGLAVLRFGAGTHRLLAPRTARAATASLQRLLEEGVARDGHCEPHALGEALSTLATVARQPGLAVVISDFRDQQGWLEPMRRLRSRHAVLALDVSDPAESRLPAVGRLALIDPETGARIEVDTSSAKVRRRFAEIEDERRAALTADLRRLRVDHVRLSTEGDWLLELGRGLR